MPDVPAFRLRSGHRDLSVLRAHRPVGLVLGGVNNSVNDPSGIGNAAKVAPPPPPSTSPTGR
jgi:hypothetical protein